MAQPTLVLGIESSCDECSASVVQYDPPRARALSVATFSQVAIHQPYGGVVPEIASRNHLETINEMIEKALADSGVHLGQIDAIAVTNRPGLVGALLVGVSAAKTLAYALGKPLIPVNHLEGHVASLFLDADRGTQIPLPFALALVSGGHTNLYVIKNPPELWPPDMLSKSIVGRSRDDAAGEAFDKTAKLMGFPYPGGMWIDKTARGGDSKAFDFPRALPQKATLDFSFSGLKTAVSLEVARLKAQDPDGAALKAKLPDLCASVQEAIVDALLSKLYRAANENRCKAIAIVGGVAANSRLRSRLADEWQAQGFEVPPLFPDMKYCTDNAAMIATAGALRFRQGVALKGDELLTLNAIANPEL